MALLLVLHCISASPFRQPLQSSISGVLSRKGLTQWREGLTQLLVVVVLLLGQARVLALGPSVWVTALILVLQLLLFQRHRLLRALRLVLLLPPTLLRRRLALSLEWLRSGRLGWLLHLLLLLLVLLALLALLLLLLEVVAQQQQLSQQLLPLLLQQLLLLLQLLQRGNAGPRGHRAPHPLLRRSTRLPPTLLPAALWAGQSDRLPLHLPRAPVPGDSTAPLNSTVHRLPLQAVARVQLSVDLLPPGDLPGYTAGVPCALLPQGSWPLCSGVEGTTMGPAGVPWAAAPQLLLAPPSAGQLSRPGWQSLRHVPWTCVAPCCVRRLVVGASLAMGQTPGRVCRRHTGRSKSGPGVGVWRAGGRRVDGGSVVGHGGRLAPLCVHGAVGRVSAGCVSVGGRLGPFQGGCRETVGCTVGLPVHIRMGWPLPMGVGR